MDSTENNELTQQEPSKPVYTTKADVISRLKEIVQDVESTNKTELDALKQTFYKLHLAEQEKAHQDYLEQGGDPEKFINGIVGSGHESVIEHQVITVEFVTDRAASLELVRHRIAAYSQESTRYVKYKNGVEFIKMIEFQYHNHLTTGDVNHLRDVESLWKISCQQSADAYREIVEMNCRPETARSVLNNSQKTSIVSTFNLREWRHVFVMRCGKPAHPVRPP